MAEVFTFFQEEENGCQCKLSNRIWLTHSRFPICEASSKIFWQNWSSQSKNYRAEFWLQNLCATPNQHSCLMSWLHRFHS
jgi:hypothetical protein